MADQINDLLILGGGDAGLLTALALRRLNPEISISVVDDFDEKQPEVGKSTYFAITPLLHDFLEIQPGRFLQEVQPVWKSSLYFKDWTGHDPFHYAFDIDSIRPDQNDPRSSESLYHYYETKDITTIGEQFFEQQYAPLVYSADLGSYVQYPTLAYHLPIRRLNAFLRTLCEERNIELINDRINDVQTTSERNWILEVSSDTRSYTADLYIDVSGFSRRLISQLETEYRSFEFPLDRAWHATAAIEYTDIEPSTVVETGEHGWFWQIDTVDCRDLGYVYASEFVTAENAREEFIEHRDEELQGFEQYHFDSGFYQNAWIGNCVVNGNAGGFVEPLESTALTTHLRIARRLARLMASTDRHNTPGIREAFNGFFRGIWNSIYDFLSIHYHFAEAETPAWSALQSIELTEKIERHLEYYNQRGLVVEPRELIHPDGTPLTLASCAPESLYHLMVNMDVKSEFYENHEIEVTRDIEERIEQANRYRRQAVSDCLTYEEVYRSGVVDEYQIALQPFVEALQS